jgi:aldose sugar dehydrogenase
MRFTRVLPPITSIVVLCTSIASAGGPTLRDPSLGLDAWVSGLNTPTGLTFLPGGGGDAFIIQKDNGQVQLMHNRAITGTALDLAVANDSERGLLGIALHPQFSSNHFVYLYYSAARNDGGTILSNRIDRFVWNGSNLAFNKRILNLPGTPGPNHDGGRLAFGPEGKLYASIGDLNRRERTENVTGSNRLSLSGVIMRLNDNGTAPTDNPFFGSGGAASVVNRIYAYGVRNSFGLAFDPKTKLLWDSEPGVESYDEINTVTAGFNSGWVRIMGPRSRHGGTTGPLVSLGAKAKYADPQFSWRSAITPTGMAFLNTSALGAAYNRDLFVGSNDGFLYDFSLVKNRKALSLSGPLADRVADNSSANPLGEQTALLLGSGFGVISDVVSDSNSLFVMSLDSGTLYRIRPAGLGTQMGPPSIPEPSGVLLLAGAAIIGLAHRPRRRT